MPATATDLVALFDLAPAGGDRFVGRSSNNGWKRIYGGQVLAQALVASARTVESRAPHSMHAYFLLAGDPAEPILYEVERLRDGRSFTTRRVVARQRGEAIFVTTVSFQTVEDGLEHFLPPPQTLSPEDANDPRRAAAALGESAKRRVLGFLDAIAPIEFRPIDLARYAPGAARDPRQSLWMRIGGELPDDPAIQRAALVYLSDMTLLDTTLVTHGYTIFDQRIQVASLDHALWFHRPARADDWLLYVQESPNASGARGLARGLLYSRAGTLVASVAQEGLIRSRAAKAV